MEPRRTCRLFALAKPWLAGLLAVLWMVVVAQAVGHHHEAGQPSHHECAACQIVHGTVLADGSVGVSLDLPTVPTSFQSIRVDSDFSSSDLRLSPGRAPPA